MSKERILFLDVIRIMACVMIIMMHAPIPGTDIDGHVLITNGLITVPGVGLFVMVSGALLLPVKMPTRVFLKKRLTKILFPAFFWTLVYMTVNLLRAEVTISELPRLLISIPFSAQFNGAMWFIYMLVGLYLLAPIISPWLEKSSKRELEFYLAIWAITLCYPVIRGFVDVNEGSTGLLYYFGGYAGYFLLGFYLRRYTPAIPLVVCCVLIAFPFVAGAYCKLRGINVDFFDVFYYLSILTVCAAIGWFVLLQRVVPSPNSANLSNRIAMVSNYCFGIYLAHIFVMRSILWRWSVFQELGGGIQIIATTALTFAGSILIAWVLSILPFGAYLVGFKNKNI